MERINNAQKEEPLSSELRAANIAGIRADREVSHPFLCLIIIFLFLLVAFELK